MTPSLVFFKGLVFNYLEGKVLPVASNFGYRTRLPGHLKFIVGEFVVTDAHHFTIPGEAQRLALNEFFTMQGLHHDFVQVTSDEIFPVLDRCYDLLAPPDIYDSPISILAAEASILRSDDPFLSGPSEKFGCELIRQDAVPSFEEAFSQKSPRDSLDFSSFPEPIYDDTPVSSPPKTPNAPQRSLTEIPDPIPLTKNKVPTPPRV